VRLTAAVVRQNEFFRSLESDSYPLTRASLDELLLRGKTPRGAWNRDQLELLGVPWPLVSGWKCVLLRKKRSIDVRVVLEFLRLAPLSKKERSSKRTRRDSGYSD
jgi:hypothetical protein